MRDFYGTGIEICAGFGPVDITEKKLGLIMRNFLGCFFQVFMGKKIKNENIEASALNSCIK